MSSLPAPVSDGEHVAGETAPTGATPRPVKGYRLPGEGSSTVISVVSVVSLFALWWIATHFGWIRDLFLPTPERIITSFADAWKGDIQGGKPLAEHFWWSLYRVFAAFILACLTAIPVGIAMGVSRIARGIFDPPIEFYRPLPPLAYLPLIVIWFGIDETAKIVLIYLACFAPLAMAARAGVRSVTIEQINAAYSMGASQWQVIGHVVIPAAMPEILTGMRIANLPRDETSPAPASLAVPKGGASVAWDGPAPLTWHNAHTCRSWSSARAPRARCARPSCTRATATACSSRCRVHSRAISSRR